MDETRRPSEIESTQQFLETCRTRFAEAQRRFQAAHQNLQRAQQEFAAAQLEHNNWNGIIGSETARLARLQQAAKENQVALPMTPPTPEAKHVPESHASEINKTELVRELLSQHPEGMSPGEIWAILKNQIPRPYLYSILKRLRDADQVIYQRRRKKYSLRVAPKNEEVTKDELATVH